MPQTEPLDDSTPRLDIRARVAELDALPVIPQLARRLLDLRDDPDATVEQLVDVVRLDPGLAALIIRYANSPLYGQHDVDSLDDAIFRVLGFENVLNLALGKALSRAFRLPGVGPLSLAGFWHNALFSAALMQKLASRHGRPWGLQPGNAWLCGLLHNIGQLVLASLFETEYFWLNKALLAKPEVPPVELENRLLGLTHAELGARLMQAWQMPPILHAVTGEHHNPDYRGDYPAAVWLVQVTDQLLRSHNMSDAASDEPDPQLLDKLELPEEELYLAMDDVLEAGDVLEAMVKGFGE